MPPAIEFIAADAVFITFPVTDGDASRRPDNMKRPPLSAKEVNWHRKMTMEEKYACRWRNLVGQGIAKLLKKPDVEKYCLKSFPVGYWMFEHNKGPITKIRHDIYLYGSKNALRFRSPAEFIPHGLWLLTDPTLNIANCGCKYCGGGKSQTQISSDLGLPTNRGPMAVTGGGSTRIRTCAIRVPRPFKPSKTTGIDALPLDTPWVSPTLRQETKNHQILSLKLKLAASTTRISELGSRRRFRLGELVWCTWEAGHCDGSPGEGIYRPPPFWPALVLDYSLEPTVHPSSSRIRPYSILHKRHYSLLRLGSSSKDSRAKFECIVNEDTMLPWQAHKTGLSSWPSMRAVKRLSDGQVSGFTFALRTAQRLAGFWAVCNRLPIRVPSSVSSDVLQTEGSALPFQLSQRASRINPDTDKALTTLSLVIPPAFDSSPQSSPVRLKPLSPIDCRVATGQNAVEKMSKSSSTDTLCLSGHSQRVHPLRQLKGPSIIESRYEGLWYGAERIWIGDVVRLCPERGAFELSLKSSHMAGGDAMWQQKISPSPGAEMRCVLMRVDRIFARMGNSGVKECAVAGPLYELAPEEWVKKHPTSVSLPPSEESSSSQSDPVYYPWDIPQEPPPRLARDWPRRVSYPLPSAPLGYTWRQLLPRGTEIALPLSFIAGRYYPDILQWSLCATVLPQVPQDISSFSLAAATETLGVPLLSLCGLAPGRLNHSDCVDIRLASRIRMMEEAASLPD